MSHLQQYASAVQYGLKKGLLSFPGQPLEQQRPAEYREKPVRKCAECGQVVGTYTRPGGRRLGNHRVSEAPNSKWCAAGGELVEE